MISQELVKVRDLGAADVDMITNYWFHSPAGFIERMGVDLKKMPTEEEMRKALLEKISTNSALSHSKINALVITYDEKPVGFHTLFPFVEGESGVFHAHVSDEKMRGQGLGLVSYVKACRVFIDRFNLHRILFKTPMQNLGAIRVKEKLGIRHIGEEIIEFGVIQDGTKAKVFELTRAEVLDL